MNSVGEKYIDKVFSVKQVIDILNVIFKDKIGTLKIKGEISELDVRPTYARFRLKDSKDADNIINCMMWRGTYNLYSHLLQEGEEVMVSCVPNLHKQYNLSFIASKIEPIGEGAWKKALEALKKKLKEKGWFDDSRKQAIPDLIQDIGIISSSKGAAITDFMKNVGEFGFNIELLNVKVEGDKAEEEIVSAIKWFNLHRPNLDVLIIIRGGGSLESLKAFNSERIAEQVFLSKIPVISGIGHERDESIVDLVSDKYCSTPSMVADFIRRQREMILMKIDSYFTEIDDRVNDLFKEKKLMIKDFYSFLNNFFEKYIQENKYLLRDYSRNMLNSFKDRFVSLRNRLEIIKTSLTSLNPEEIFKRGYSVVYSNGKLIKDIKEVKEGDELETKLYKGELLSIIKKVKK
jgi:exodeoxyribonuclease VII large subunit